MSYTKQIWTDGQVITAQKLNHMEGGIASGGVCLINVTIAVDDQTDEITGATVDKTPSQVYQAFLDGETIIGYSEDFDGMIFETPYIQETGYTLQNTHWSKPESNILGVEVTVIHIPNNSLPNIDVGYTEISTI